MTDRYTPKIKDCMLCDGLRYNCPLYKAQENDTLCVYWRAIDEVLVRLADESPQNGLDLLIMLTAKELKIL